MIERQMVRRMVTRGLWVAPVVAAGLWLFGGPRYALSGAVGLAMALFNLWLSGRVIGGVAEHNPSLLLVAGLGGLAGGLALLTAIAFLLQSLDAVFFPVTGLVLIGSHLGLVLWEASGGYAHADVPGAPGRSRGDAARARS